MPLVVTIGRENGSGGREIGRRLAKDLNIAFYDNNLLDLTAKRTNFDVAYMEKREERAPGLWVALALGSPMGLINSPASPDQIFQEQAETIRQVAAEGSCVIVGRASNYILRDVPTVDIFVYAPIVLRVKRKMSLLPPGAEIEEESMRKKLLEADQMRARFYSYYTGMDWGPGSNFDLNLNTGLVGIDGAVKTIETFLEQAGKI